ncbi:hypothetical protein [Deinococcus soli (ex Cha et al. 2016)]|uniref:hypothetical protein n=1 Tax=Deinococcus soli (ex Cha et al. 2016) TaxID=1309411 RepID=UPI0016674120|nr:hypothetical protein [Deinococcus soli (ex Cha et al. 2016)]GGB79132.1 hypothetical protein GCM10008019_39200 [Deinococcus soli (ex Cha et al. 2016)]
MTRTTGFSDLTHHDLLERVTGVEAQLARPHHESPAQAAHWLTSARKTYIWAVWAERQQATDDTAGVKEQLSDVVDHLETEWFTTLDRIDAFAHASHKHSRLRSILSNLARRLPTRDALAEREVGLLLDLLVSEVRMVTHPHTTTDRAPMPGRGRISKQGRGTEKAQPVAASSSRRFRD